MSKTWEERMAGAAQAFGTTSEDFENGFTQVIGITKQMGTSALDDDEILKFGDFREAYKDKPIAVLRMAFKSLREGRQSQNEQTGSGADPRLEQLKALGLKVKLEDADVSVLLPLYDPNKPSDPVTLALKKRFSDKPLIAFRDDGTIALEETLRNIADIEQGFPEADAIQVDGKLARLWPLGRRPDTIVEEDPLFPGKPLRNGYSTVNNRNWSKIPQDARQLCRIIVERGEINVENREAVLRLMERATEGDLGEAYLEAEMEFRERKKKDDLPKLRVELGSLAKPNNPFGVPRRY
jgi:hypothetical protein